MRSRSIEIRSFQQSSDVRFSSCSSSFEPIHPFIYPLEREQNSRNREATILRLRYGLGEMEEEPMTLKEIGKRIGLTRERVRQLEAGALRKLYKTLSDHT